MDVERYEMYLKSASKRSTVVVGEELREMKTSARRTVGFSRRRGVAYKSSNSLMGGDESIRGTTLTRCCLLVAVFACGAVTKLSWQPFPGQILVRHKSTNSATKTGS